MKFPSLLLLLLVSFGILTPSLQARRITWSNELFDSLYDSQGVPIDATFTFELGTFINGFVPTSSNLSLWEQNWIAFDATTLDTSELFPGSGPRNLFGSEADITAGGGSSSPFATPGGVFPVNSLAYLWVYDSKAVTFTSEWALVTDLVTATNLENNWRFPAPGTDTDLPLSWNLVDADTAIFGAVQSGASQGGGNVSVEPSQFSLQTYQVPEPGGAVLVASAGILLLLRRSRFLLR
jgi:hypothetical protein